MLAIVLIAIFLIVFVLFCDYVNRPPGTHALRKLEGPPPYFLFGHVPYLPSDIGALTKLVLQWCSTYKSPMRLKAFQRYGIYVYRADHVETIMKDTDNISKSPDYHMVRPWLGDGLLLSEGVKWHQRRKLLTPAFHYQILKEFMPIFNDQAYILVEILKERDSKSENDAINISPYLTKCTLDIICETAMGKKLDSQHDADCEYARDVNEFSELLFYRIINPWFRNDWLWNITPKGRKYKHIIANMHAFTKKIIAKREIEIKTNPDHGEVGNNIHRRKVFLDLLLEMKSDGKLNENDVCEEVDTFMFEGHDTTATGLMWALYCIGLYKDVQQQLFEEIISVCGTEGPLITEKLPELHLLDRVLKESQRLYPSVPLIGRKLTHPIEIDGTTLYAGIKVDLSILSLHRDPNWFDEPEKFDPDRFLPENVEKRHPFAFMPFAAGQRNCIGQKFALMEEKVILVHLIRAFKFEAVQDPKTIRMVMVMVLRPFDGIWLKVQPRNF